MLWPMADTASDRTDDRSVAPDSVGTESAVGREGLFDWIGLACRSVLGAVILIAGALKLPNLGESVLAVRGYDILPYEMTVMVGYVLPILEVLLGLLLVSGLLTRISAIAGTLLMLAFTIAIAQAWARGISIDCGCFGGGGEIAWEEAKAKYPWEIARDIGLAMLGGWLIWRPRSRFSADNALF